MLVAATPRHVGSALIDYKTPLHFGVGFAAGALGVSPHIAAIAFLAFKAGKLAVKHGFGHALFEKTEEQSYGNEIMDLTAEMVGIGFGLKARELFTGEPAHAVHGLGGKIVAVPQAQPYPPAPRRPPGPRSAAPAVPGPLDGPLPIA